MTTERSRDLAALPRSPSNRRSSRAPGLLGRHEVDPASAQPLPAATATSKLTPPLAQYPSASLDRQVPTQAVESRWWTLRATPSPAIAAVRLPAPPPPSTTSRSDTVDTGAHGHRTPTPGCRTGGHPDALRRPHRTLDSGRETGTRGRWTLTPDSGHRTPDTGPRTPDTGHRTPDTGRGRGHGDEGTAGTAPSWAAMLNGGALDA
jgi:hypothetical protein